MTATQLVVVVPTRGRPARFRDFLEVYAQTTTGPTMLYALMDDDDPTVPDYPEIPPSLGRALIDRRNGFAPRFNDAAANIAHAESAPFAIANLGDDHLPRTPGWDLAYLEALRDLESGVVYGNDLWQREALPTAPAITSDVIRVLGWYSPPGLRHVYVDNFWRALGIMLGRLRYLPQVIVEHMHHSVPVVGDPDARKGAMDDTYAAQDHDLQVSDAAEWERYRTEELEWDVARVRWKLGL